MEQDSVKAGSAPRFTVVVSLTLRIRDLGEALASLYGGGDWAASPRAPS